MNLGGEPHTRPVMWRPQVGGALPAWLAGCLIIDLGTVSKYSWNRGRILLRFSRMFSTIKVRTGRFWIVDSDKKLYTDKKKAPGQNPLSKLKFKRENGH
jgi:hypothetical protein